MSTQPPDRPPHAAWLVLPEVTRAIEGTLRRRGLRGADLEDHRQVVLERALVVADPPGTLGECMALVQKIARDLAIDTIKQKQSRAKVDAGPYESPDDRPADEPGDVADRIDERRRLEFVRGQLETGALSARQAEILTSAADEVPQPEIAAQLKLAHSTVRNELAAARRMVRIQWAAFAAAIALAVVFQATRPPPPVGAAPPSGPTPDEVLPEDIAAPMRIRALTECEREEWKECLRWLDAARILDPEGEDEPRFQKARGDATLHLEERAHPSDDLPVRAQRDAGATRRDAGATQRDAAATRRDAGATQRDARASERSALEKPPRIAMTDETRATDTLRGKVALVTGANTGIGLVTARELARRGAHVFMACRSAERAAPALEAARTPGGGAVEALSLDLGDLASVRRCAAAFLERDLPLHLLVNNAGLAGARGLTASGFELAFGVNHVGHFLFTNLLLERIKRSAPARIVTVASKAHADARAIPPWEKLRVRTRSITGLPEYAVSKLANVMFSATLARRLEGTGVTTYSLHPGVVATDVWRAVPWPVRGLIKRGMISADEGVKTTLYCATAPETASQTGLYYDACAVKEPSAVANDVAAAEALWRDSEAAVDVRAAL